MTHPKAMSDDDVREVRLLAVERCTCGRKRYTLRQLSERYGVSAVAIHYIVNGVNRKGVK